MKTKMLFLTIAMLLDAAAVLAQNYKLHWFTMDAGGGTGSGDKYIVGGTVGQPAAAKSSAGNYTLSGGLWSILAAIQTTNAPLLALRRDRGDVIISWTDDGAGWVLETTPSLSAAWLSAGLSYRTNGTLIYVTETLPTGNRFYRLRKP
jgi:hypothetical protein